MTQNVDELHDHDSFGGTALMYNTRRTATVISSSTVEVLMIDIEAFQKYCKSFLLEQNEKQKNFLNSHNVFNTWSHRRLATLSYDAKRKSYRSGKIIDYDLINSKYLYFVMEGAVDVIYCDKNDPNCWLFSRKLNQHVGVLGGSRIYAPNPCNLDSLTKTTSKLSSIKIMIISHSAAVIYLPKTRVLDLAPKNFFAKFNPKPTYLHMSDHDYWAERKKAVQWMEYRSVTAKEIVRVTHLNSPNSSVALPRLKSY